MTDTIQLTIPADHAYNGIATLVLGGIGARLDLSYERVDELQLAVLSLLDASRGQDVTLQVDAEDGDVRVTVGPLTKGSGEDKALTRVLERLVDEVSAEARDGQEWLTVRLTASR